MARSPCRRLSSASALPSWLRRLASWAPTRTARQCPQPRSAPAAPPTFTTNACPTASCTSRCCSARMGAPSWMSARGVCDSSWSQMAGFFWASYSSFRLARPARKTSRGASSVRPCSYQGRCIPPECPPNYLHTHTHTHTHTPHVGSIRRLSLPTFCKGFALWQLPAPQVGVLDVSEQLLLLRGEALRLEVVVAAGRAPACRQGQQHSVSAAQRLHANTGRQRERHMLHFAAPLHTRGVPPHLMVAPLRFMSKCTSSDSMPASAGSVSSAAAVL